MPLPHSGGKMWACMPRKMRLEYILAHPERSDLDVDAPYLPQPTQWTQDPPVSTAPKKPIAPKKPTGRQQFGPGSRRLEKQVKDD